jgi:hypothetical protein
MSDEIDDESKENGNERNMGTQPMDALMTEHEMNNHELLSASPLPMSHKAVQRARKGRRLTRHMQRRMVEAFNLALFKRGADKVPSFTMEQLFNYRG